MRLIWVSWCVSTSGEAEQDFVSLMGGTDPRLGVVLKQFEILGRVFHIGQPS